MQVVRDQSDFAAENAWEFVSIMQSWPGTRAADVAAGDAGAAAGGRGGR